MSSDTEQQKGSNWHKIPCASFLLLELLPALLCQLSQLYTETAGTLYKVYADHMKQKVSGLTLVIPVVPLLTLCLNQEKQLVSA